MAVTSGDLAFLFTTWQGYAIILLVLILSVFYIAIEVNSLVIYIYSLLSGDKPSVLKSIKEGVISIKRFFNPRGILIIVFALFISPIIEFGFSISLTGSFYIPNFIMSVIVANPTFMIAYLMGIAVLLFLSVIFCFVFHGVLVDGMTIKEAFSNSKKIIKSNLKNYLFEIVCYIFILLLSVIITSLIAIIPLIIVILLPIPENISLFFIIFFIYLLIFVISFFFIMSVSFFIIKLSLLYNKYKSDGEYEYKKREKKRHPIIITAIVLVLIISALLSVYHVTNFNEIYKDTKDVAIVAHRAGGFEAPENTVKGIEVAYSLGAKGCEIDIQRTNDGYYVINHDSTFARVAGVDKKPNEMSPEEVKELRVDGEPVPTLEEMLDASKDKVILFVELKGETCDDQMADDAVRIIKENKMEDQTVLISLQYNVLEYIEQKYPEMKTGYLAFFSYGQIENTPFDYLALEEEVINDDLIDSIHAKGKKLLVWTVNEEDGIEKFMTSEADGIITDSVNLSGEVKDKLAERTPLEIIIQKIFSIMN